MATSRFRRAERRDLPAKVLVVGPSGGGKTYTSLTLATALLEGSDKRLAFIDTEGRSSEHYADVFDFDVAHLGNFTERMNPRGYLTDYRDTLRDAYGDPGYGAVVVDSFSHAWAAVLALVDESKRGNNTWSGWSEGTPAWQELLDLVIFSGKHTIVTTRSRTEWVLNEVEDDRGRKRTEPTRVGTSAQARHGLEYEFQLVVELDLGHHARVTKSRVAPMTDAGTVEPDAAWWQPYVKWLASGVPAATEAQQAEVERLRALVKGLPEDVRAEINAWVKGRGIKLDRLWEDEASTLIDFLQAAIDAEGAANDPDGSDGGAPADAEAAPRGLAARAAAMAEAAPAPAPAEGDAEQQPAGEGEADPPPSSTVPSDASASPPEPSSTSAGDPAPDATSSAEGPTLAPTDPWDLVTVVGEADFWPPTVALQRWAAALAVCWDIEPAALWANDGAPLVRAALDGYDPTWLTDGAREGELLAAADAVATAHPDHLQVGDALAHVLQPAPREVLDALRGTVPGVEPPPPAVADEPPGPEPEGEAAVDPRPARRSRKAAS